MLSELELIVKAMDDKLASNIKVIDFRNNSPFYDYFLIGSALNNKMANSIIDNIYKISKENNIKVRSIDSSEGSNWYIIDLFDIVVHIFTFEAREVYALEKLWGDMPNIEVQL